MNEAMKADFNKWVESRYMHPDLVFRHGYAWDAWQAALSQQPAQPTIKPCIGRNCGATDGISHSAECLEDYDIDSDKKRILNEAGRKHTDIRYRGYTNQPIHKNATDDEKLAWQCGKEAREDCVKNRANNQPAQPDGVLIDEGSMPAQHHFLCNGRFPTLCAACIDESKVSRPSCEPLDGLLAVQLLSDVFNAWENGIQCYDGVEEDSNFIGQAFRLEDATFKRCCELLNRVNPPRNAPPDYEALRAENERLKEREQWIHDNATASGGGHGFTVTFFVPVDHEDIFCGISDAIKLEQK